jgi:SAM-dependent methyltransferase
MSIAELAKALIPKRYRRLRRLLRMASTRFTNFGLARYCPCCKSHIRRFLPFAAIGAIPKDDELCPVCGSFSRHRLVCMYLSERTALFDGRPKTMLHISPEPELSWKFKRARGIEYVSADLDSPEAMVQMDITDIPYSDETFDVIYCSHVLEHVEDDRTAMRELFRVLKAGGWAILQVPIMADATLEDPTVVSREDRLRVFGQADHVRRYGPDYADRLAAAGFSVSVDGFARELDDRVATRLGLNRSENVFFCRKTRSTSRERDSREAVAVEARGDL